MRRGPYLKTILLLRVYVDNFAVLKFFFIYIFKTYTQKEVKKYLKPSKYGINSNVTRVVLNLDTRWQQLSIRRHFIFSDYRSLILKS